MFFIKNCLFIKKVKFFALLYPEAVYKKALSKYIPLMKVYENIEEKIDLSKRQQQRIKHIYKHSLVIAIKKKTQLHKK